MLSLFVNPASVGLPQLAERNASSSAWGNVPQVAPAANLRDNDHVDSRVADARSQALNFSKQVKANRPAPASSAWGQTAARPAASVNLRSIQSAELQREQDSSYAQPSGYAAAIAPQPPVPVPVAGAWTKPASAAAVVAAPAPRAAPSVPESDDNVMFYDDAPAVKLKEVPRTIVATPVVKAPATPARPAAAAPAARTPSTSGAAATSVPSTPETKQPAKPAASASPAPAAAPAKKVCP